MEEGLLDNATNRRDEFIVAFVTDDLPFTNWSAHQIYIWGKLFPTVEHAYQYKKFADTNPSFANKIRNARSPWQAKSLAYSRAINRRAWDLQRERVMTELLAAKLGQHEDVRKALLKTGNLAIIAQPGDDESYWSIGKDSEGRNTLGRIWITLRNKISV